MTTSLPPQAKPNPSKWHAHMVHVHETSKVGARSAITDSCFSLIGPRQCSVAQRGPATSTVDP